MDLISRITDDLPFSQREARELIATAPSRYKVHLIEKRNGRGFREIAQPTAEIKLLQRWALCNYVESLPIHDSAKAYRKGIGIRSHAEAHSNKAYLLKLDFKDFFPSILGRDIGEHFRRFADIAEEDIRALVRLFCWYRKPRGHLRLSIGAPSSPMLSNTVMYSFDVAVAELCEQAGAIYTRYADDLAISTNTPHILDTIHGTIQAICREQDYPRVSLNKQKTVFTSKKHQRQLTGLILTNDGHTSLGHDRKRQLRAMTHRFSQGLLDQSEVNRLRGLLAFAASIDPNFIESLQRMIGFQKLDELKRMQS